VRQTMRMSEPSEGRNGGARRLALGGLVAGLVPLLLLGPMFVYQMEFMLYTWAWPTLAGALGLGLSGLAWYRAGADRRGRLLAGVGLTISALGLVVALAGWVGMMASMVTPMPAMPMP
jgi:hypothetical protein